MSDYIEIKWPSHVITNAKPSGDQVMLLRGMSVVIGDSAYEIAKKYGYPGDEAQWNAEYNQLSNQLAALTQRVEALENTSVVNEKWYYASQNNTTSRTGKYYSGTYDSYVYEHKHWVGGGDLKQIRFGFDTVATGSGSNVEHIAVGQDLQIEKAVAIYNNTLVPMEFSGARSVVVPDGTYDYLSDSIDASAFGVSVLPHDAQITVRVLTRQTSAVSRVALSHKDARQFGGKSIWFNSSDTSLNDFETLSGFSVVGPTQTARTEIAIARLHGLSDAPDFVSIGVRGDSITQGTGDSGFSDREGGGWAFRAVQRFSKQPALMNYASHGSTSRMLIEDQSVISSYNLLTHAITAYGANNIGQSNSNPDAYLSLSQDTQTQLAQFKAAGLQAGVMHLIPRTSSTDLWRTEENQTINTGWGAGGAADNYNNDIANFSDADFVIEMSSIRGTERLKTVTNGEPRYATFDGTHPSAGGADLMSQDAAVVLNTEYGFELIS